MSTEDTPGPHSVTRAAHAKINLSLSVGMAQPAEAEKPGWHKIASWMACIGLADDVTLERIGPEAAGEPRLQIHWAEDAPVTTPIDWPPEKDLAVRALKLLEQEADRELPAQITIAKRIPPGGGLGGGSADAAATLIAGNELFALGYSEGHLQELAARLGSDVPYFIDFTTSPARPAMIGDFGDRLERVERITSDIILIVPAFGCPTQPVYKAYDDYRAELDLQQAQAGKRPKDPRPREATIRDRFDKMVDRGEIIPELLFNDLAKPAFRCEPRLGKLVTALGNATREPVHVTGSGSCCFIACTPARTERIMERVERLLATLKTGVDDPLLAGVEIEAVRTRLV